MYLVLVYSSWLTEPKTLGSSYDESDKGVFCYVTEVNFGPHLRMDAGCQENQPYN